MYKNIIFILFIVFLSFCGKDKDQDPAKIVITYCRYQFDYDACYVEDADYPFAKCQLFVETKNIGGKTAKNVNVRIEIENNFGALQYSHNFNFGDIGKGEKKQKEYNTYYDFTNMAKSKCKLF